MCKENTQDEMVKYYKDGSISVPLDKILSAKKHIYKGMVAVKLDAGYMDLVESLKHEIDDGRLILKIKIIWGRKSC